MTDNGTHIDVADHVPEAVLKTRKSFSIVWIVPLVAALIGGGLVYKALSEKGTIITIVFRSAEGLKAGETKIKYKDVEVGSVESIRFSHELENVIVTAELTREVSPYLTDKTRFWVVRARISSGEVSGLGTLFGGAYIEIDPQKDGKAQRAFVGLEHPPVITTDTPGGHFNLKAAMLGSLKLGSPVYYRQIQVGTVDNFKLAENGRDVDIRIFIHHPYHQQVKKHTRFWNAGGIDLSLNAEGMTVNMQSIVSIISGGLAFDNLVEFGQDEPAAMDQVFTLYSSYQDALQKEYTTKRYWTLDFSGSVRGLSLGAPVEFKGIKVGRVLDIKPHMGKTISDIFISVLIETEPERFAKKNELPSNEEHRKLFDALVAQGLRAQLKTGSLLTGQLFVDLGFHPGASAGRIAWEGQYPNFPTVQLTSEEVLGAINKIANTLESFPVDKLSKDIQAIVENVKTTTEQINTDEVASIISNLDKIALQIRESDVGGMLIQAQETLLTVEQVLSTESQFSQESTRALKEVANAAARISALADYLERHPEALIRGKEK